MTASMTLREWCRREGHPVVGWDTDGSRCICGERRPGGELEELHALSLSDRIAVSSHAVDQKFNLTKPGRTVACDEPDEDY